MKKRLALVGLLLTATFALQAKPVDPQLLLRAAQHVLGRADLVDATPASLVASRLFVGADGHGFVLLAADDASRPLLGYSATEAFPADAMPEQVSAWLEGYDRDIAHISARGIAPSPRAIEEWRQLLSDQAFARAKTEAVRPLVKTRWGQSGGYNAHCPYDSLSNVHCVTGCVATAMAQVLRYWQHPATGRGSHSYTAPYYGLQSVDFDTANYRWNKMPNSLSMASQAQVAATAELLYHAGVAVDMDYGVGSSGAHTNPLGNIRRASSETALKEFFRYNPALFAAYKEGFTDAEWRAMIDEDLEAGRPVLYDGYGPSGGHAFVLDGRDTMGLYHFNWGWDGNANGYFTLDSLAPTEDATFSTLNSAVFHIYPITVNPDVATVTGLSADPARGTVSGSGTYSTDTLRVTLLATAKPGYRFDHWTSGNPANPIITSPTLDLTDTAVFVPIHRDTVGYCRANGIAYKNLTDQDTVEWGIRIPAPYLAGKERLQQVQFWTYEASGPYLLRIYRGNTPDQLLYTDTFSSEGYGMLTRYMDPAIALDPADTTPLWITVYTVGHSFPISYSHFTGTSDGSWVHYGGQWQPIYNVFPVYGSWMLRAVLDPATPVSIRDLEADSSVEVHIAGRSVAVVADGPAALYDMQGRCLAISQGGRLRCTVPAAGIYVVRAANAARKIIVF